ncbi:MAG: hypothetical protein HC899_35985 [Leptolyngbyaceae cyanobacterium SM1_4_3]|nr:hypothetical protein [Leptolyngbyaceae cyanobacterium SM1_4_3]
MGAVSFSIDITLVKQLQQVLPLSVFVETGTFEGETVSQVLGLFDRIHTVELSQEYYTAASKRFQHQNVSCYHDSSERFLKNLCPALQEDSVLYWLDAHWCVASATAGEASQCPLLKELEAIHSLNSESVILIDDARLFLCTPPKPHSVEDWPTFDSILKKISALSSAHELMVINDVIVYYPACLSSVMKQYAHENSIDWLYVLHQNRIAGEMQSQLEAKEAVIQDLIKVSSDRLAMIEKQQEAIEQIRQSKKAMVQKLRETAKQKQQRIEKQRQELQQLKQAQETTWPKRLKDKLSKIFS